MQNALGKKVKKVNVELIQMSEREDLYDIMNSLISQHHCHLAEAKIALAWREGWKPDKDGNLHVGQCRKASDLDRELHDYDFIILLNREVFNGVQFSTDQKTAILDHELCHADVEYDEEGDLLRNMDGRVCYRIRRHDIEEFHQIVKRHGLWRDGLARFIKAATESERTPLLTRAQADQETDQAVNEVIECAERLRPKPGSGIEQFVISSPGLKPIVLKQRGA